MKKFMEAIKLGAKLREKSYDKKASYIASQKPEIVDFDNFYNLSLIEAADKAAEMVGFDKRGTQPIYLLLKYCWNDILDWANQSELDNDNEPVIEDKEGIEVE